MYWFLRYTPGTGPLQNLYETVTNPMKNHFTDGLIGYTTIKEPIPTRDKTVS